MLPQAVLFDLDNTLTHRQRSIEAYAKLFAHDYEHHLDVISAASIATVILNQDNGGYLPPESIYPTIRDAIASALSRKLNWRKPVTTSELASHWASRFPSQTIEMPGAKELVQTLAEQGVKVAIVSNGAQKTRQMTLDHLSFKEHICLLVSSEAVGMRKPDSGIFSYTASELDLSPNQCCYIGDHPINDIMGAFAAGMQPIWLSGFHIWPEDMALPALSVAKLSDILSVLE